MRKKNKLGRGLGALLGEEGFSSDIENINVSLICPNQRQPRRFFDDESLKDLAESIKKHGLVQPVIVRKNETGYELIAGERRLRATKLAGIGEIPAIVQDYTDTEAAEIALIENLQRENLNPLEEASAYRKLIDEFGMTQEKMADSIGKSRSYIANILRLLSLPEEIQTFLSEKKLTVGQIRPLLALSSEAEQIRLARYIAENELSARQVEKMVSPKAQKRRKENIENQTDIYFQESEEKLKITLGTDVHIRRKGKKNGIIEISFSGDQEFERIFRFLHGTEE